MYRNLNHLVTFAALAETGSFAGAARRLDLPSSTVSEHIAALEKNLGLQLVLRTTRKSRLTESGRRLARDASRMVSVVEEAMAAIDADREHPQGKLRISLPFAFAAELIGPAVGRFTRRHPGIELEFVVSNDVQDLIAGGFDMAIRIGELEDSTLRARKLTDTTKRMIAAPAYFERFGRPQKIDDLNDHKLLHYSSQASGNVWKLTAPSGEKRQVRTAGWLSVNDGQSLLNAAISGLGIAYLPSFLYADALEQGLVIDAIPELPLETQGIYAVYPPGRFTQPKVRAFIDFLVRSFAEKGPDKW